MINVKSQIVYVYQSYFQDLIGQPSRDCNDNLALAQMEATLKELLFLWFSVGFLKIERVTWQTSCDILQKV